MNERAPRVNNDKQDNFDASRQWPDQLVRVDGVDAFVPAQNNYVYGNRSLPIARQREEIIAGFDSGGKIEVLEQSTGSGKTTSGPQYFHETDNFDKVIVTEPTIVTTRESRNRVAREMMLATDESHEHIVGLATSRDHNLSPSNRIMFMTHGAAYRYVANNRKPGETLLVMVDEAHERNKQADILIAECARRGLYLVISSATLDAGHIARRYSTNEHPVPVITSAERRHSITHERGADLRDDVVNPAWLASTRLVFLPGKKELDREAGAAWASLVGKSKVVTLHGDQNRSVQSEAIDRYKGNRTVFATNIAQTGLTVSGNRVTFNPGWDKRPTLNNGVPQLSTQPASKAANDQRAGRAGREGDGTVVFGSRLKDYPALPPIDQLDEYDKPELLTTRLDSEILQVALSGDTLGDLPLIDYPEMDEVHRTNARLRKIGAFDEHDRLTETGMRMAGLGIDPMYARMLIESEKYFDKMPGVRAQIAGLIAAQYRGGFMSSEATDEKWRKVIQGSTNSDPIDKMKLFKWARNPDRTAEERAAVGIVEQKFEAALEEYEKLCEREGIDSNSITDAVDYVRIRVLKACILSGADEVFVRRLTGNNRTETYRDVRGDRRTLRKTNSAANGQIIVGVPWNLQTMKSETLRTEYFINEATAVDRQDLKDFAPHRCTYQINGYDIDRFGNITAKNGLYFDGQYIDDKDRVGVVAGQELKEFIVGRLFAKSTSSIKELPENVRTFCKLLEETRYLEQKTPFELQIEGRLADLRKKLLDDIPNTITSFADLDEFLDGYDPLATIDSEMLGEINDHSPDVIGLMIDGEVVDVPIVYSHNQARIRVTRDQLDYLPEVFPELSSHDVFVQIGSRGRLHTLAEARERALAGGRDAWRGNVRDINTAPSSRRKKDEDPWDGTIVEIQNPDYIPGSPIRRPRRNT